MGRITRAERAINEVNLTMANCIGCFVINTSTVCNQYKVVEGMSPAQGTSVNDPGSFIIFFICLVSGLCLHLATIKFPFL